jgi:hypothetical protein
MVPKHNFIGPFKLFLFIGYQIPLKLFRLGGDWEVSYNWTFGTFLTPDGELIKLFSISLFKTHTITIKSSVNLLYLPNRKNVNIFNYESTRARGTNKSTFNFPSRAFISNFRDFLFALKPILLNKL